MKFGQENLEYFERVFNTGFSIVRILKNVFEISCFSLKDFEKAFFFWSFSIFYMKIFFSRNETK